MGTGDVTDTLKLAFAAS